MSIWEARSINGRWGIQITHPEGMNLELGPVEGTLRSVGKSAGIECFEFVPKKGSWVLAAREDLYSIEGASCACKMGLQGNSNATVLILGPSAIVKYVGYKGRSSSYHLYINGEKQDAPVSVLLALGLIEPEEAPTPINDPPKPSSAFAEALASLKMVDC